MKEGLNNGGGDDNDKDEIRGKENNDDADGDGR